MTDLPRRLVRAEQVLAARTRRIAVVLEEAQDPRNVHAVLRTAEALGVQDVHVVAPRGPAAAVAPGVTQGAHDWLSVRRHDKLDAALRVLRAEGREIWAADPDDRAEPLTGLRADRPIAILLGNETTGLSDAARAAADRTFRIDLVGFTGSVNLATAAAIVLWELRREEVAGSAPGDLSDGEARELRTAWYGRLTSDAETWLARAGELRAAALAAPRETPRDRRGES